jgi:hypothetical protein
VFIHSVPFTLLYTAIVTGPMLVLGYAMAAFVRANRPGSVVFRTAFFLPFIVGLATALLHPWSHVRGGEGLGRLARARGLAGEAGFVGGAGLVGGAHQVALGAHLEEDDDHDQAE